MPDKTSNRGYNRPDKGATDWNVPLNENFAKLDRDVLLRDTESNLSDYYPKEGSAFLSSDTGRLFIGDGSSWMHLGYLSPVRVFVQSSEPTNAEEGDIWVDTN